MLAPDIAVPAALRTLDALEHEVKYLLPSGRIPGLSAWLASVCLPEPRYPPAYVHTVYFDTPDLSFLADKIGSTYLKTKVRLRWYAPLGAPAHAGSLFAEAKFRVGSRREKVRVALPPAATSGLLVRPLSDPAWAGALEALWCDAPHLPRSLAPVLALRYIRRRFVDPRGPARLTIDDAIAVTGLNRARVNGRPGGGLSTAVFEMKGPHSDLPAYLHPVVRFGGRRGCFSKYLACYQHATGLVL